MSTFNTQYYAKVMCYDIKLDQTSKNINYRADEYYEI